MSTLSTFEAECLVSKYKLISIENIGNLEWMNQHEYIEKLNIQCHKSAQSKHDEYVVNEILTQDKLSTIIYNLISIEIWKEKIFPFIINKINDELSIKTYMILYEEATLITILQILLYHSSCMEQGCCSDDTALLELVDYCHRKLTSIVTNKVNIDHFNCHLYDEQNPSKLIKQKQHLEFTICSCCVSIIRFITQHLSKSSISVVERVINTNEIIMVLISLIVNKPWTKKNDKGFIEKYNGNNQFIPVDKNNMYRLTKIEGELWLSVYNLLLDKVCGNKYRLNSFRRNEILKLKPLLIPQIIDQLPILKDLKRTLEELTIMNIAEITNQNEDKLIFVQIVPEFRENLLNKDFKQIANKQLLTIFNSKKYNLKERKKDMEILSRIYNNFDGLEDILFEQPICVKCGQNAEKRCSRCKSEWYCSRQCQLKSWKKHKKICDVINQNRLKYDEQIRNNDTDYKENKQQPHSTPFIKEIMSKKFKK